MASIQESKCVQKLYRDDIDEIRQQLRRISERIASLGHCAELSEIDALLAVAEIEARRLARRLPKKPKDSR